MGPAPLGVLTSGPLKVTFLAGRERTTFLVAPNTARMAFVADPGRKPSTAEESSRARVALEAAILSVIGGDATWSARGHADTVPDAVAADVERLCDTGRSYRDAALTLLAFPAGNLTTYDVTDRFEGDRQTSDWLGKFLKSHDIEGVKSALQNSSFRHTFVHDRIDSAELRRILIWASDRNRGPDELRLVFDRIARRTAETARVITPLPPLDATRFTFQQTLGVIDQLLSIPSGGANEQYTFAALKAAEIETSTEKLKVKTKNVMAADAGRTAADVQVVRGQAEIVEAYEIAVANWTDKIVQAAEVVRQHGLSRVHIVANAAGATAAEVAAGIAAAGLPSSIDLRLLDVSVLDLRSELTSLVARLSKSGRTLFVLRLWELLGSYGNTDDIRRLVDTLDEAGLLAVG